MGNCLITKLAEAVDIEHPIYIDGQIVGIKVTTANVNEHSVVMAGKFKMELIDNDAYFTDPDITSTVNRGTVLNFNSDYGQGIYGSSYVSIVANRTGIIRAKLTYVENFAIAKSQSLQNADWDSIYANNKSGVAITTLGFGDSAQVFTSSVDKCTPLTKMAGNISDLNAKISLDIDHFANNTALTQIQLVKNGNNPNITISGSILNLKSTNLTSVNFYNGSNYSGVTLTGSLEDWAAQQVSLGRTSGTCTFVVSNTGITYNGQAITSYSKTVTFDSSAPGGYTIS